MLVRAVFLVALLSLAPGCATSAPPNLSPQAQAAWRGTRIIHALDMVRDIAIDANAQSPPLLNEATTRQVVLVHQTLITIIHSQSAGWREMVLAGLAGLIEVLPTTDYLQLRPYIQIARAAVLEFQ